MKVKMFNITKFIEKIKEVSNRMFVFKDEDVSIMGEDDDDDEEIIYGSFYIKVLTDKYISEVQCSSGSYNSVDIRYLENENEDDFLSIYIKDMDKSSGDNGFMFFEGRTLKEINNKIYCNISVMERFILPFNLNKEDFIEDYELPFFNILVNLSENEIESLIKDTSDEKIRAFLLIQLSKTKEEINSEYI